MNTNKYRLDTSFGIHSISLFLHDSVIDISRLPVKKAYGKCYFKIINTNGYCEYRSAEFNTLPNCFKIPYTLKDGSYRLYIYLLSPYGEGIYYNLFGSQGIPFRKQSSNIEFIPSSVLEYNKSFLSLHEKYLKNGDLMFGLKPSHMIQSTDPEIKGMAKELTSNSADTISKIRNIYFFVSRTLQYDKESCDRGSYCYTGQTAYEALKYNKCVCQGFANLVVAMCRAIGIPSFSVCAFIKPDNKQWEELGEQYKQLCESHQVAFAWVNCFDRWVVMDPTWDNDQYYDAKGWGNRYGNGLPYKYFDLTTEFISYTHRFEEILNI